MQYPDNAIKDHA